MGRNSKIKLYPIQILAMATKLLKYADGTAREFYQNWFMQINRNFNSTYLALKDKNLSKILQKDLGKASVTGY